MEISADERIGSIWPIQMQEMGTTGGYTSIPQSDVDFGKYWEDAKTRWLRPNEIYDILCNYQYFKIWSEPPNLPPSGTLILFNRKILRNFRRDGHLWRKKKDNKTVKEAHEHLKVESEEKIHVYYAHGDNDPTFHRRVYWLLDKKLEHIVLVHYLQVKEGNRVIVRPAAGNAQGGQHNVQVGPVLLSSIAQVGAGNSESLSSELPVDFEYDSNDEFDTFSLEELKSSTVMEESGSGGLSGNVETGEVQWISHSANTFGDGDSYMTNPSSNIQHVASNSNSYYAEHELTTLPDYPVLTGLFEGGDNFVYNKDWTLPSSNPLLRQELVAEGNFSIKEGTSQVGNGFSNMVTLTDGGNILAPVANSECLSTGKMDGQLHTLDDSSSTLIMHEKISGRCEHPVISQLDNGKDGYLRSQQQQQWELNKDTNFQNVQITAQLSEFSQVKPSLDAKPVPFSDDTGFLKDLESMASLERWILYNLPSDNRGSYLPIAVGSTSYHVSNMQIEDQCMSEGASSLAPHHPVAEESTPSISQNFLFNITEFSPMWGFSSEETKVVITGIFMGEAVDFKKYQWCCVFNETEVPAEIVQDGVLKCKAPPHAPGHVPVFLACGGKQACSEVRIFEYRDDVNSLLESHSLQKESHSDDDEVLKVRLARLLVSNSKGTSMIYDMMDNAAANLHRSFKFILPVPEEQWDLMENQIVQRPREAIDCLLQILLKYELKDWLLSEVQAGGKGLTALGKHGHGVLHLASALGYDWAIAPILAAGVGINFRDKNGWTALHWAAAYGRENMVAALLVAGANPRMVSDPTPKCPSGLTPADFAAHAGHNGIAAYLSESDLMTHLSSLTLTENEYDKQAAAEEGSRVVEYLRRSSSLRRTVKTLEDEVSLNDSLSSVRNATEASARIQAAFREYSLRERLRAIEEVDEFGFTAEEIKVFLAAKRIQKAYKSHRERKLKLQEIAVLQIQNKYRGWKGRKDFLNIKQKVIKIQAYYRMHRARKQYHKIVWSVGVLEKAVLRWRQKKKGLRGYSAQLTVPFEGCESDDFLRIGRRQVEESIERSVVRVQAMVRSHQARKEYRRMLETYKQAKVDLELRKRASQESTFSELMFNT